MNEQLYREATAQEIEQHFLAPLYVVPVEPNREAAIAAVTEIFEMNVLTEYPFSEEDVVDQVLRAATGEPA